MRRAASVLALAAVIATSAGYLVLRDFGDYAASQDLDPTVVRPGETTRVAGSDWGPLVLEDVTALREETAQQIPRTAHLLLATFTIDPASELPAYACSVVSLADATGRAWATTSPEPLPDDFSDAVVQCGEPISSETEVRALFRVPRDAEGPFTLTVDGPDGPHTAPRILFEAEVSDLR